MKYNSIKLVCAAALSVAGFTAAADTIYDNAALYNSNLFPMTSGQEVGNEISLSGNWNLQSLAFEYYTPDDLSLNSSLGVEVRMYLNNGPGDINSHPTPGTVFYDSGLYTGALSGNGAYDFNLSALDLYDSLLPGAVNLTAGYILPSDFTFTVTFYNMGSDTIDIPLADNSSGPNVTSYGDYWANNGGTWTLLAQPTEANYLADFEGVQVVPEPSVFYLGAFGGALLLGAIKLKRKRNPQV